jgi:hypothetical protein
MGVWRYTPSGNVRFLSYIPSWWKNQPWLERVGGGCTPTPFHSIYHYVRSCSVRSAECRHTPPYFTSTPICTLWYISSGLVWQGKRWLFWTPWVEKFAKLLTEIAVCKYMEDSMDWRRKHISHKFPIYSLSQVFPNNRLNNLRFFKCYG